MPPPSPPLTCSTAPAYTSSRNPAQRTSRRELAVNVGHDVLQRYGDDLDAAFEQSREQGDLTPLVQTVRRWWFEADAWRDPAAQRSSLFAWTPTAARGRRLRSSG
jgi:hypothetical protein